LAGFFDLVSLNIKKLRAGHFPCAAHSRLFSGHAIIRPLWNVMAIEPLTAGWGKRAGRALVPGGGFGVLAGNGGGIRRLSLCVKYRAFRRTRGADRVAFFRSGGWHRSGWVKAGQAGSNQIMAEGGGAHRDAATGNLRAAVIGAPLQEI